MGKGNWLNEISENYGSLENYVKNRSDGGAEPLIYGYDSFQYLWDKELLKEDDILRTNLEGGFIDGHYRITSEGKLEGIDAAGGLYSGRKGIHKPKDRLNVKVADNGWTIDWLAKGRICERTLEDKL